MSEIEPTAQSDGGDGAGKLPYVSPAIVWEEDYRPTVFGISCAKLPADISCTILVTS
jgi:hypothetical protein